MNRLPHWLVAATLAIVLHGGLLALAAASFPEPAMERSAGHPGAVWGLPVESIADTISLSSPAAATEATDVDDIAEAEPVETTGAIEAVDAATPVADVEPVEAEPVPLAPTEPAAIPEVAPAEAAAAENTATAVAWQGDVAVAPAPPATSTAVEAATPVEVAALEPATEALPDPQEAVPVPRTRPADVPRVEPKRTPPKTARKAPAPKSAKAPPASRSTGSGAPGAAPAGEQVGSSGIRQAAVGQASVSSYAGRVAAHLQRHKRYPDEAAHERLSGTATVTFTISSDGSVRAARLARSSGQGVFDREVVAMVGRAAPFPPIPQTIGKNAMTFTVPVRFKPR